MVITFEKIEEYLMALGKNYSMLFNYEAGPLKQLKIHYAPHVGEFYYSFRNSEKIDVSKWNSVDFSKIESIGIFSGLLISFFEKKNMDELINNIENKEHFSIQKPEVIRKI